MLKQLVVPLCALFALVAGDPEITYYTLSGNGGHCISAGDSNFAFAARSPVDNDPRIVSVNGKQVNWFSKSGGCNMKRSSYSRLDETMKSLIADVKAAKKTSADYLFVGQRGTIFRSRRMGDTGGGFTSSSSSHTSVVGDGESSIRSSIILGSAGSFFTFIYNGLSMQRMDENNYSIAKAGLPNSLARIFVNNNMVTFIYQSGEVWMKPVDCLLPDEEQVLRELKEEAEQTEAAYRDAKRQRAETKKARRLAKAREKEERRRAKAAKAAAKEERRRQKQEIKLQQAQMESEDSDDFDDDW